LNLLTLWPGIHKTNDDLQNLFGCRWLQVARNLHVVCKTGPMTSIGTKHNATSIFSQQRMIECISGTKFEESGNENKQYEPGNRATTQSDEQWHFHHEVLF
jgi:hypothetical protein